MNPPTYDEATGVSDADGQLEDGKINHPNDCAIVETLTEDEANAIEDMESSIDFCNWFNRVKRLGRKAKKIHRGNET